MNKPENDKKWPNTWFVVMCNGCNVYASKLEMEANSLANRLSGSLSKTNLVNVVTQPNDPTKWHA